MVDKIGTDSDEDLVGGAEADLLDGKGGNDRLYGKAGNDVLYGRAGDDLLDGMTGADTMFGGAGNDRYRVDDVGDVVSEDENNDGIDDGGIDLVESSITFTLPKFVENLTLTGTAAINGTGNELDNRIKGNTAANVLIGGQGRDTYTGGGGADTFVFGPADSSSTDRVTDFDSDDRLGIFAADYRLSEGSGLTGGKLSSSHFAVVSSGNQATTSHGQFIYSISSRTLMWDADGAGGAAGIAIATFDSDISSILSIDDFLVFTETSPPPPPVPSISVSDGSPNPQIESDTGKIRFTFTLSGPADGDVVVSYRTVNGTAVAGSDFVAREGSITIPSGATSGFVDITLKDDNLVENTETFKLELLSAKIGNTSLTISNAFGTGTIADNDSSPPPTAPVVVQIHSTQSIQSTDPSALAYVPGASGSPGTLFLSDSEVDEEPFYKANNLFALRTDGSLVNSYSLASFTKEPTGLAFDTMSGRLLVCDDDKYKIWSLDPSNPTANPVVLVNDTRTIGATDPEDLATDGKGNIFIANGIPHTITTYNTITKTATSVTLDGSIIKDPEALAYDPVRDVFFVGGGFSYKIWIVSREGKILDTLTLLKDYRNGVSGTSAKVKDLEFAPSSDPNDDPRKMNLYVADYGNSHVNDGRLIEIDLGTGWFVA